MERNHIHKRYQHYDNWYIAKKLITMINRLTRYQIHRTIEKKRPAQGRNFFREDFLRREKKRRREDFLIPTTTDDTNRQE